MRKKKSLITIVALVICFLAMSVSVFAKTETQDGLRVTVLTDRPEYDKDEDIKLTVKIVNENEYDMYHINVAALLPAGLEVKEGKDQEVDTLKAGEVYEAVYTVRLKVSTSKNTTSVETGDSADAFKWVGIFAGACGWIGVAMYKLRKSKKFVKALAVILCLGITATSLLGVYASEVSQSFSVIETIKIDGKNYEVGVTVGYIIDDTHDHGEDNHNNGTDDNGNPPAIEEPDHDHVYIEKAIEEPTCIESGWITKECEVCGEIVKEEIPATGHTLGEWVTVKEATYTEPGMEVNYCTVCGDIAETREISVIAHEHDYQEISRQEATCAEPGKIVEQCSICGTTRETEIPALGHSAGDWVIIREATYTEPGLRVQYCQICGDVLTEEEIPIVPHEHNYETIEVVDPTCTQEGKLTEKCTVCGGIRTTTIPANGHTLGEWTVEREATCIEQGVRVQRCTVCGDIINSEEIEIIPHSYIEVRNTATCTAPGISYQICEVCGVEREVPVPALGHDMEVTVVSEATCTSAGLTKHMCTRCHGGEMITTQATGHNWVITYNNDGSWNEHCTNEHCTEQHNNINTYTVNLGNGETAEVVGYFNREMSAQAYGLMNTYRLSNNRKALSPYEDLNRWADTRALEIAYKYSNAHIRPDGTEYFTVFGDLVNNIGYGENISSGSSTAETLINGWIESVDHRNNMLMHTYNYAGLSVFTKRIENENGTISYHNFGVQLFNSIY